MTRSTTDHVWLVMMKAMRALTRYAAAGIEETGLGLSVTRERIAGLFAKSMVYQIPGDAK